MFLCKIQYVHDKFLTRETPSFTRKKHVSNIFTKLITIVVYFYLILNKRQEKGNEEL